MAITVSLIGANGYTGQELLRWLKTHPHLTKIRLAVRQDAGKVVDALLRQPSTRVDHTYYAPDDPQLKNADCVFFATPHGTALANAASFLEAGCKVIDLSADFRLRSPAVFKKWYGLEHDQPALLREAVYGLSEINAEKIRQARLVANPGCYASAVQLGLIPLIQRQWVQSPIIADVKSGVSGAGKKLSADYLYHEVNENFRAYSVSGHRHQPEIMQGLIEQGAPPDLDFVFTPHLVPMQRGILATIHAKKTSANLDDETLHRAFSETFADCPFIHINAPGNLPQTAQVIHSNLTSIGWEVRRDSAMMTIVVALDNMVKGAAGQAIQNMNEMFGFAPSDGLI